MNPDHPLALRQLLQQPTPAMWAALIARAEGGRREILTHLSGRQREWMARLDATLATATDPDECRFAEADAVRASAQLVEDFGTFPDRLPVYPRLRQVEALIALLWDRRKHPDHADNLEQLEQVRKRLIAWLSDPQTARLPLPAEQDRPLVIQLSLLALSTDLPGELNPGPGASAD